MFVQLHDFPKPSFLDFTNEKVANALAQGRSVKQLYLSRMKLFEFDQRDRKKAMGGEGASSVVAFGVQRRETI